MAAKAANAADAGTLATMRYKMRKVVKYIGITIIIITVGFVSFLLYETKDEINANFENVEEKINELYDDNRLGGFAVSVFSKDSIIYMNGFGFANKENNIPYTINTQQYIASISKTTIGVALLKASEIGLVELDESINTYLPFKVKNPNYPEEDITLRHLAKCIITIIESEHFFK